MSIKQRLGIAALVVSAAGLVGLASDENYTDKAVIPVPGDRPTYGFGSTFKADGQAVKMGDKTDPVRALILLEKTSDKYAQAVKRCAPVPMHQYEFDTWVRFTYNVGENTFCKSTAAKKLNAQDYAGACAEMLNFVCGPATEATRAKKGEKCYRADRPLMVTKGLVNRRQREYKQCIGAV